MTNTRTLADIAIDAAVSAAGARDGLPAPVFTQEEAVARTMIIGHDLARSRGVALDWSAVPVPFTNDIVAGVYGSRCLPLSSLVAGSSAPEWKAPSIGR